MSERKSVSIRRDGQEIATADLVEEGSSHHCLRVTNAAGLTRDYKIPAAWIEQDQAGLSCELTSPLSGDIRRFLQEGEAT